MSHQKRECRYVSLSEELIIEILKRLPVKSLRRFVSVCKSWYFLIKNPTFVSTHSRHQVSLTYNNDGSSYMLYYDCTANKYYVHCDNSNFDRHLQLDLLPRDGHNYSGVGFCDGIFCFYDRNVEIILLLWNPLARQFVDVVVPHCNYNEVFYHGFGYDPLTGEYKAVVCVCWIGPPNRNLGCLSGVHKVYIYSVNSRTWRVIDASIKIQGESRYGDSAVHVNAMLHWLVERATEDPVGPYSILMFNLADETFREVFLAHEIVNAGTVAKCYLDLMTLKRGGREVLAVVVANEEFINIWVLQDDGTHKFWKRIVSVKGIADYESIINVRSNGEIIASMKDGGMVSFNPGNMEIRHICDQEMRYIGPYIQNLVSL